MNKQLIEKVIKSNSDNNTCPELPHDNALLSKDVARALSRSFVKILKLSQSNSNINNNLRYSVLANIRKICQVEPENHLKVDEKFTHLLTNTYLQHLQEKKSQYTFETVDQTLDEFLIKEIKELNIDSKYPSSIKPDTVQALVNLNENDTNLDWLSNEILHWNHIDRGENLGVLKDLWNNADLMTNIKMFHNITIKMKTEIEKYLLDICYGILSNNIVNIDELFSTNANLIDLMKKCSNVSNCFQVSTSILNSMFILTEFDLRIKCFIHEFIKNIKRKCQSLSTLYPLNISHIAVLMDFNIDALPEPLKSGYVQPTIVYLKKLHSESESSLIMLLSHFPQWFDDYYKSVTVT